MIKGLYKWKITLIIGMIILMSVCLQACNFDKRQEDSNPLFTKIRNKESVSILVNGDSIASSNSTSSWPMLLSQRLKRDYDLKDVYLSNISLPGNGAYGGYVIENVCVPQNVDSYDLVVLCYGQNDYDETLFPVYYEALVRASISDNPNAQVLTILESSQGSYPNKVQKIIEISEYYGIPCVDMIHAFDDSGYGLEELTTDSVHPTNLGHDIYADTILDSLKQNVFVEDFRRANLPKCLYKETEDYEYFCYIDKEKMAEKENELSFVVNHKVSCIGTDRLYETGQNELNVIVDKENYHLSYSWEHPFEQRHINRLNISSEQGEKINEIVIEGNKDALDNFNGIVLSSNSKLPYDSNYTPVLAEKVESESISVENELQNSILDAGATLKSSTGGFEGARNYFVGVYVVREGEYLNISSNTIGDSNTITRYAFYENASGTNLIKGGGRNTGGWSDKYDDVVQVPEGAKYLFVTCQNGSDISVSYSNQKSTTAEISSINMYPSSVLSSDGNVYGSDVNTEYTNYSVYIYDVTGMNYAEVETSAIGNPDTFMIYALSDIENAHNFNKKGRLNSAGWNKTPSVRISISQEYRYLYVLCQNGTTPKVVVSE